MNETEWKISEHPVFLNETQYTCPDCKRTYGVKHIYCPYCKAVEKKEGVIENEGDNRSGGDGETPATTDQPSPKELAKNRKEKFVRIHNRLFGKKDE